MPDEVARCADHRGHGLHIKPGFTGLWQIDGRPDLGWNECSRLDLYHVEKWTVTRDLQTLWRTSKVIIEPEGAH
ncbi:sugar transferase [Citricoccus nitrophenolicus]